MTKEKISKETISTYAAHKEHDEFIIDYLSSLLVYEYDDDALMLRSSLQCFDEDGRLNDSWHTTRKEHEEGYIYERYNHNGELEGHIIRDKDGRELESTLLGQHRMTYDADGRLLSQKSVYIHEDSHENSYTYDPSGRLVQSVETRNGKTSVLNHHYSEDISGNIVETSLDSEGNLVRTIVYDKISGHIIESKEACDFDPTAYDVTYYSDHLNDTYHARVINNRVHHNTYRNLEYDNQGNWVLELVNNNVLGEPQFYIKVRDIVYQNEDHRNEF